MSQPSPLQPRMSPLAGLGVRSPCARVSTGSHTLDSALMLCANDVSVLPLSASQASTDGLLRSWTIMSRCVSFFSSMSSPLALQPLVRLLPVWVGHRLAKPFSPSPLGWITITPSASAAARNSGPSLEWPGR